MKSLHMLKTKQLDGLIICSRANDWETIEPYASYGEYVTCEDNYQTSQVYIRIIQRPFN